MVAIFLLLNSRSIQQIYPDDLKPLLLIHLQPPQKIKEFDVTIQASSLQAPDIKVVPPKFISTDQNIEFLVPDYTGISGESIYELPDKNSHAYERIFDPRLRKKLQENRHIVSTAKPEKLRSWKDATGATLIEIGEGSCIRSMPTVSYSKETSWSILRVKCGKDESDRMMDNINADLESRKNAP